MALLGASWAAATGPLGALERLCTSQDGQFTNPVQINDELVPHCSPANLRISAGEHWPGAAASASLFAANNLCRAAGFAGVNLFARAHLPTGDTIVFAWWCSSRAGIAWPPGQG